MAAQPTAEQPAAPVVEVLLQADALSREALADDASFDRGVLPGAGLFGSQRRLAKQRRVTARLNEAGRGMAVALRTLLDHREVWDRLAAQDFDTVELDLAGQAILLEVVRQHLPLLLHELGYGEGPPSPEEWVGLIQRPLRLLVETGVPPAEAVRLVGAAQAQIRVFVARLESLVQTSERVLADGDPDHDAEVVPHLRRSLRRALIAGREKVVPGVLATAVVTAAFTSGAPVEVLAAVAGAGGQVALQKSIDLGSTAVLAVSPLPDVGLGARNDLRCDLTVVEDCLEIAADDPRLGALLLRRVVVQTVLDATPLGDEAARPFWDWALEMDELLAEPDLPVERMRELVVAVRRRVPERSSPEG